MAGGTHTPPHSSTTRGLDRRSPETAALGTRGCMLGRGEAVGKWGPGCSPAPPVPPPANRSSAPSLCSLLLRPCPQWAGRPLHLRPSRRPPPGPPWGWWNKVDPPRPPPGPPMPSPWPRLVSVCVPPQILHPSSPSSSSPRRVAGSPPRKWQRTHGPPQHGTPTTHEPPHTVPRPPPSIVPPATCPPSP